MKKAGVTFPEGEEPVVKDEIFRFSIYSQQVTSGNTTTTYKWCIDETGTLSKNLTYTLTKDNIASFKAIEDLTLNLKFDSTCGNTEVENLISKLRYGSLPGANSSIDFSKSSATTISSSLGSNMTAFSSIKLPDNCSSVTKLFDTADACNLTQISISSSNSTYYTYDGILYNKGKTKLIKYPASRSYKNFTLPDTVEELGDYAFSSCKNLQGISNLAQVKKIGKFVFYQNTSFKNTADLSGLTQTDLSEGVFREASNVGKVILSDSVRSIGAAFFYQNDLLTEVHFNSTTPVKLYGNLSLINFTGCNSELKIYVPAAAVDAYKNASTGENGFSNPDYNALGTTAEIQARIFAEE